MISSRDDAILVFRRWNEDQVPLVVAWLTPDHSVIWFRALVLRCGERSLRLSWGTPPSLSATIGLLNVRVFEYDDVPRDALPLPEEFNGAVVVGLVFMTLETGDQIALHELQVR
jgi:hypothetical protein